MVAPISYDKWEAKYKPVKNHLDPNASHDGRMFETYGPEYQHITDTPEKKVWTIVTGDNGEMIITAGYHYVNRLGYLVTEKPWEKGTEFVLCD